MHNRRLRVFALRNHAKAANRMGAAPKIPSIDKMTQSKRRKLTLAPTQLGIIVAVADHEPEVQAGPCLSIATGVRPDATFAFNPVAQ